MASDARSRSGTLDAAILVDALLRLTEGETVIDPTIVAGILGRK